MTNFKQNGLVYWLLLVALLSGVMAFSLLAQPSQADDGLPVRPTLTPTIVPDDDDKDEDDVPLHLLGAHIQLQAGNLSGVSWAEVQWQDSNGGWQVVDGWRGQMTAGSLIWWVHPRDFNTGPFRWVVKTGPDGERLGASAPFIMPGSAGEVLVVTVSPE